MSLVRIQVLLAGLGDPQERIAPAFHLAGTNGKGSVGAYLRALGRANGQKAHVMTSPHLMELRERFRIQDALATPEQIESLLQEIWDANAGAPLTIFEALTALGFLAFARRQADFSVIETGLGGRFDATNVIKKPSACLITSIGLDHQHFLGDTVEQIALEKAGIIKDGVPVFSAVRDPSAQEVIAEAARQKNAPLYVIDRDFHITLQPAGDYVFSDETGSTPIPAPSLAGAHQLDNAALGVAAYGLVFPQKRHDLTGLSLAEWPGRIQKLTGRLPKLTPDGWDVILDGAHNPQGAEALAAWLRDRQAGDMRPVHLLFRCSNGRDAASLLTPLMPFTASLRLVDEPSQDNAKPLADIRRDLARADIPLADAQARDLPAAIHSVCADNPGSGIILICGSLYLAGEALRHDGYKPV